MPRTSLVSVYVAMSHGSASKCLNELGNIVYAMCYFIVYILSSTQNVI